MKQFDLNKLVRENIKNLKPYSSARSEYKGDASVFLDANENSYGSPLEENYNRYPDPLQWKLKLELSRVKGVPPQNIFIGNGSDEVIDLAFRIFCEPLADNIIICPPTYGMYKVSGNINNVQVKEVMLTKDFDLDVEGILEMTDNNTRIIFLCSPNNPTGNNMSRAGIEILLNNFNGLVIIDEAYINYSRQKSFIQELTEYENLVVMQTFSKAWGLAGLRLGLCFASESIIEFFNKVKPPYNINDASQQLAIEAIKNIDTVNEIIKKIVTERKELVDRITEFSFIEKCYPSDANFILVKTANADKLYNFLLDQKIIVRNRSREPMCENCLRITIGTSEENKIIIDALKNYGINNN